MVTYYLGCSKSYQSLLKLVLLTMKHANITYFPKPGKPADWSTSYRPMSFLYHPVKVLECLLQPKLKSLPLSSSQHGFRPNHYTVSMLLPLVHKIAQGFNQPRLPLRTLTRTIDLTKTFDMHGQPRQTHPRSHPFLSKQ